MSVSPTSGFLGRDRELDAAWEAISGAFSGRGSAVALAGEPGIGKTRLATELSQRAAAQGLTTLWGRAWESGGAPSYWPWRQLLEAMRPEAADSAGPLRLIWSKAGSGDFATNDPKQARFELFDAVVRLLREQSQRQPALCVLDDLHAADVASIELAEFAIGALAGSPLAWVVTWRDAEAERLPVRDTLARLSRRCRVFALPRLSLEQTSELVHQSLPGKEALAGTLFHATSGNPLFLHETMRALADGREMTSAQLPVSQGVALVVRDRVATLSAEARALAELGAVLGREGTLDVLTAAAGEPVATVRARAAEVTATGLWSAVAADRWLFSHALVRDALFRELSPGRAAELQAKVATALDALVSGGRSELSLSRALHALDALAGLDAGRVAQWAIAAANQARAQRAYEEAAGLLERASRELTVGDEVRAELLLALGWAFGDLGDGAKLEKTFDEAIVVARRLGDATVLGRAVLGRGSLYTMGKVRTELFPLIDEALAVLPETEVALRARLWARKASAMTPAPQPEEPLGLARKAIAAVSGSSDTRAVLDVAVAAGSAMGDFALPAERVVVNTTLVEAARALSDRVLELRGLSRLVCDHLEAGDVARADAVLLERDALASSLGHPRFRWMTPVFRSMRAMIEGRFDDCARAIEEARRLISLSEDANARRTVQVHEFFVLMLQDRVAEVKVKEPELLLRVSTVDPFFSITLQSLLQARSGQTGAAAASVKRAVGGDLPFVKSNNLLCVLAESAVLCGDAEAAKAIHAALQVHADSSMTLGFFGLVSGLPVRAHLGLLQSMLGHPASEVRAHFEAALERTAMMGAPAHEAWVRLWYGQHLASRAEAAEAREQLRACATLAERLGITGLAARANAVLPPAAPEPVRAGPVAPSPDFALVPHEGGWRLERGGNTLVLKGLRGMAMLSKLLQRPGEEVHALELVSGDADEALPDAGDAGELLDEKAKAAYRKRIETLTEQIEDAEERGDAMRAERGRTELEALSKELSRAVGLGGRSRRAASSAERARVTAQRRLREAIKKIGELDAELGALLERTVRTGTFCAYEPNRRARK